MHTIRPMQTPTAEEPADFGSSGYFPPSGSRPQSLHFPFRQNTIARRAHAPGEGELAYQFAKRPTVPEEEGSPEVPTVVEEAQISDERRSSAGTDDGLPVGCEARQALERRLTAEAEIAEQETKEEIDQAVKDGEVSHPQPGVNVPSPMGKVSEANLDAALRQGDQHDEILDELMDPNPEQKRRMRMEKLAERLQEVFGLQEREPVLEEMRCWLLTSVSECTSSYDHAGVSELT